MENTTVTHDELLAALQKANTDKPRGLTTREICKLTNRSPRYVNEKIRDLIEAGVVESSRRRIVDVAGRAATTYEYRLKRRKK